MAETRQQAIEKCKNQLEGLFVYLGSLVAGQAVKGKVNFQAEPSGEKLKKEIENLLSKVQDLASESLPSKPSKTVQPPNQRGTLSPYVEVNLKLHETKKKFVDLREDVDSCLSLASLHLKGENRTKAEQFLDRLAQTENTINVLFEKISGSIRQVMSGKKEAMEKENPQASFGVSKTEKDFLKRSESQVRDLARGVDGLIGEAKTLFESIKTFYEQDAEARLNKSQEEVPAPVAEAPAAELSTAVSVAEAPEDETEAEESMSSSEIETEEDVEEVLEEVEEGEREPETEIEAGADAEPETESESEEAPHPREAVDEGMLEAARRKLASEHAQDKEKFDVLRTLFCLMEGEQVADFLIQLFEKVNVIVKLKILDLVAEIKHPSIETVYERFMTSPESLLRLKGIVGLSHWRPEETEALMMRAAADEEASIRRFAANCIRPHGAQAAFIAVTRLAGDKDDQVARVAIRKLAQCRHVSVAGCLIPGLRHSNPKIRKETIDSLRALTGESFGYRPNHSEKERVKAAAVWEKFWEKHKADPHFFELFQPKEKKS